MRPRRAGGSPGAKEQRRQRVELPETDKRMGTKSPCRLSGRESMSMDAKPKKGRGTKTRKDQAGERIKTSVLLSRSVDIRIRALSGIRGVDKSTLRNSLLDEATRGVVISLRGSFAAEAGAGEGSDHETDSELA